MALQTKTFSYGSLTDKSILKGYLLELTVVEQSTDTVANTSVVDFTLKLRSGSKNRFEKYGIGAWVAINGAVVGYRDRYEEAQVSLGYNSSVTLVSGSCAVAHNEDGTLNMAVDFSIDMATGSYVPGPVSVTGNSMALTAIPRASTVAASDANVGAVSTVVVGRKSAAYTHSVQVQFGGIAGWLLPDGNLAATEQLFTETTVPFRIPESFYTQIPNSPTGGCVLTCTTYAGATPIGVNTTVFTVTAARDLCAPALSISVRDVNENTVALTGNDHVLVRFFSTARCTVAAEAKNAAALSTLTVDGQAVAGGFADFLGTEQGTFTARCTDSRGYTAEATASAPLVPYVQLTCNPTAKRLTATGGDAVLTVRGNYFTGGFGREQNALRLSYRIDGGEEVLIATEPADNSYAAQIMLQGMDYTRAYTIEVIAADRLQTVVKTITLSPGIPLFDWGNGDFNFNVPVAAPRLTLGGVPLDYIVEQGELDGWIYRKWNSGIMECWKIVTFATFATQQWGVIYISPEFARQPYPIPFVEKPVEQVSLQGNYPAWVFIANEGRGANDAYTSARYHIGTIVAHSNIIEYYLSFYVTGKWK